VPTTPTYALRYLALTDAPDIPKVGKDLAEDVEAQLVRIDAAVLALPHGSMAFKSADEVVNNSTTFQADNHLFLAVEANKVYDGRLMLAYRAINNIDLKWRLTYPTGATLAYAMMAPESGTNQTDTEGDVGWPGQGLAASPTVGGVAGSHNTGGGTSIIVGMIVEFTLVVSSTAGSLALEWAQNTLTASDLTVLSGSKLVLQRFA
jgi:hypothetical protein